MRHTSEAQQKANQQNSGHRCFVAEHLKEDFKSHFQDYHAQWKPSPLARRQEFTLGNRRQPWRTPPVCRVATPGDALESQTSLCLLNPPRGTKIVTY